MIKSCCGQQQLLRTFFTFCHAGEITIPEGKTYDPHVNLSYEDISVDNSHDPSIISLLIKQSKIDQAREGVKVYMGKTDDNTCPVKVLLHFLRQRGSKAGPLFDKMAQYYKSHNLPKL